MTNTIENRPRVQISDLISPIYRDGVAIVAHMLYKTPESARAHNQVDVVSIASETTKYIVLDYVYSEQSYPSIMLKLQDPKSFKEGWVELWFAKGEWHFDKVWRVEASIE